MNYFYELYDESRLQGVAIVFTSLNFRSLKLIFKCWMIYIIWIFVEIWIGNKIMQLSKLRQQS